MADESGDCLQEKGYQLSEDSPVKRRKIDRLNALVACLEQDQPPNWLQSEQQVLNKNGADIQDVGFSGRLGAALYCNKFVFYSLDSPLPLEFSVSPQAMKALEIIRRTEDLYAASCVQAEQAHKEKVAQSTAEMLTAVQRAADSLAAFTAGGACVEQAAESLVSNMDKARTFAEATAAMAQVPFTHPKPPRIAVSSEGSIRTTWTGFVIVTQRNVVQFETPVTKERPDDITLVGSTVYILAAGVVRSFTATQVSGRNILRSAQVPLGTALCSFKNRVFVLVDATKSVVELDHVTLEVVRTFQVPEEAEIVDVTANSTCLIVATKSSVSFYSLLTGALFFRSAAEDVRRVAAHDACMLVLTKSELLRWKFIQ